MNQEQQKRIDKLRIVALRKKNQLFAVGGQFVTGLAVILLIAMHRKVRKNG